MSTFAADFARVGLFRDRKVAVIGFGNQGHAHALNLRDSGVDVIVGNRNDSYADAARRSGFETMPIAEATRLSDIIMLLIPDGEHHRVFSREILPQLGAGDTVAVASGYSAFYHLLQVPDGVDLIMVAPRMVGHNVRMRYIDGTGSPSFISVEKNATGMAHDTALAYAEAIGCTRAGCFDSSCREEVALDLFAEQALWPAILQLIEKAFAVLSEAGFSQEAILYELYLSAEPAEIFENAAKMGLLGQLTMHSPESQFGQLTGGVDSDCMKRIESEFIRVLQHDILHPRSPEQLNARRIDILSQLSQLHVAASQRPMHAAEQRVLSLVNGGEHAGGS